MVLTERADPGSFAVPLHDLQVTNFMFVCVVRSDEQLIADLSLKRRVVCAAQRYQHAVLSVACLTVCKHALDQ